jgi:Amt family ammonium transporter
MLASASGAVAAGLVIWKVAGKPDPAMMCNGMLAGLVAITSPCAFVTPTGGVIIGAVAGVLVVYSVFFFDKLKIDDPVGAISVHGTCGVWGLISVGLLSDGSYGQGWNGVGATDYLGVTGRGVTGLFYGDSKQLIAQIIEVFAGLAWNIAVGGAVFWVIGKVVGNRVSPEVEIAGLDVPEMGAAGYPEFVPLKLPQQVPAAEVGMAKEGGLAPAE